MLSKISSLRTCKVFLTSRSWTVTRLLSSSDYSKKAVGDNSSSESDETKTTLEKSAHDAASPDCVHSKMSKMSAEELKEWKHDNEQRGAGPGNFHHPDQVDKWILVIGGAYPSLNSVPDVVRPGAYERARQRTSIYLNMSAIITVLSFMMFLHYIFRKDQEFAEKYQIDVSEDAARRKLRHAEERELRVKRKLLENK